MAVPSGSGGPPLTSPEIEHEEVEVGAMERRLPKAGLHGGPVAGEAAAGGVSLSSREREVATLIAQGLDTTTIAERLFLSPWTVQDHCKAIFEKTGARTRRELGVVVSFHDHLPAIAVQTPLDAGGHLSVVEQGGRRS